MGEASSYYNNGQGQNDYRQEDRGEQPDYGQPNPPPYHQQGAEGGADGERGLMGAVAGGAAGAFAGHKMGHGVLGAVGGALAGHKLQDFAEDRKEKKEHEKEEEERRRREEEDHRRREEERRRREEEERRRTQQQQQQHHQGGPPPAHSAGGNYAGNFHSSSRDVHLESGPDFCLRASCRRVDGGWQTSTISLNQILCNEDGFFSWANGHGGGGGGGGNSVTVQQGDTLREIGRRFNCSWEDIARRNNISNPDLIYPGQVLQVPGSGSSGGGGSAGNFAASARDVRLIDGGRVLEAELRYDGDRWRRTTVVLDERIGNENGELRFV